MSNASDFFTGGGGAPIGTLSKAVKGSLDPLIYIETPSIYLRSSFPDLDGNKQTSFAQGGQSFISVENVPSGTYGTSVSTEVPVIVTTGLVSENICVLRNGYTNPSSVVATFSSDGGSTWAHVAVTDIEGGITDSKIPYRSSGLYDSSYFSNGASMISGATLTCPAAGAVVGFVVNNVSDVIAWLHTSTGAIGSLDVSTITATANLIQSLHYIPSTDECVFTALVATSGGSKFEMFKTGAGQSPFNIVNWTKTWTDTAFNYAVISNVNYRVSRDSLVHDGVDYFWSRRTDDGTNSTWELWKSADLANWTVLPTGIEAGAKASANAYGTLILSGDNLFLANSRITSNAGVLYKLDKVTGAATASISGPWGSPNTDPIHLKQTDDSVVVFIEGESGSLNGRDVTYGDEQVYGSLNMPDSLSIYDLPYINNLGDAFYPYSFTSSTGGSNFVIRRNQAGAVDAYGLAPADTDTSTNYSSYIKGA